MFRVVLINNKTHSATIRDEDGESMHLTVPEEHRDTGEKKLAWIKAQGDARSKIKLKEANKRNRPYKLYVIMLIEAIAIAAMYFVR